MMCYHARRNNLSGTVAREARQLLQFMTASAMAIEPVYSNLLKQELDLRERAKRLVPAARPPRSGERPHLLSRARRSSAGSRGLEFVSEVQSTLIVPESLPPDIAMGLRELSADLNRVRAVPGLRDQPKVSPERLLPLRMHKRGTRRARSHRESLRVARDSGNQTAASREDSPLLKAAIGHLNQVWPLSVRIDSLAAAARAHLDAIADRRAAGDELPPDDLKADLIRCYRQKRVEL